MPKVSLKLMAGPPVRREERLLRPRFPTAAETAARWCARKVLGEDCERPYRMCAAIEQPGTTHILRDNP